MSKMMVLFHNECLSQIDYKSLRGRRGRDRKVVGFRTTYAISAYHL